MMINDPQDFFSFDNRQRVSVIASFNTAGEINPLYVKINGETYKIYHCFDKHPFRHISEFQCQIIDNNCMKPLKLIYDHNESTWTIRK